MANSGNATRSALFAFAFSMPSEIFRIFPERSPTVLFIWTSAIRSVRILPKSELKRGAVQKSDNLPALKNKTPCNRGDCKDVSVQNRTASSPFWRRRRCLLERYMPDKFFRFLTHLKIFVKKK